MKIWEAGKELAQQKNDHRTIKDFEEKRAPPVTAFDALAKSERYRHPNDEQKEWKDQIGWRPAVPFGVVQGPVDVRPRTGIVHQHHAGDRQAAEDVERDETIISI